MGWEPYRAEGVVGDVRVLRDLGGRDLYAYLPPSHGSGRRYPLLLMHDGQNLFDEAISYNGEICVDEAMERLAAEGTEAVVVGVTVDERRARDYAGDLAEEYLAYIVERALPAVQSAFDVAGGREATGVAGSSFGAVISLHALLAYPDTFGFAGLLSPAFWAADTATLQLLERTQAFDARIYLDVGDAEDDDERTRLLYLDDFERLRGLLEAKGLGPERLRAIVAPGGTHDERAWAARLPDALRFLLCPPPR